jgi:hypothetical protein
MSNRHQNNRSLMERIRGWLVSPDGFAAAAAGSGDPAPLLALEGSRRARSITRQRAQRPDAWAQRTSGHGGAGGRGMAISTATARALGMPGIDPVIAGLLIGLLTSAYTPKRRRLARGSELAWRGDFRAHLGDPPRVRRREADRHPRRRVDHREGRSPGGEAAGELAGAGRHCQLRGNRAHHVAAGRLPCLIRGRAVARVTLLAVAA